jgi:kinesin family protein 6/9
MHTVEAAHIEETISTLRFATRMMKVSNEPIVNVQYDPQALLKKYEQDIKDLKAELAMHDALSNRYLMEAYLIITHLLKGTCTV